MAERPVPKAKKTKSRNGCVTCKAKRLKCDESKPTCQQCSKRRIECGGYKKDFKWREILRTSFTDKSPATAEARNRQAPDKLQTPTLGQTELSLIGPLPFYIEGSQKGAFSVADTGGPNVAISNQAITTNNTARPSPDIYQKHIFTSTLPTLQRPDDFREPLDSDSTDTLSQSTTPSDFSRSYQSSPQNVVSPILEDHLSGLDFLCQPTPDLVNTNSPDNDDVEEIIRTPNEDPWHCSDVQIASETDLHISNVWNSSCGQQYNAMYRQINLPSNSPEMLMSHFDKQTCGILSIRDGPTENPWRTLIWPLAHESPAIYHAIASMTAFHNSKVIPSLRVEGLKHVRQSIQALRRELGTMRSDIALATTLVLAFSESWDQHTSTGIEHLRAARVLVKQSLAKVPSSNHNAKRFKFLASTLVYMDVLARLTAIDADESSYFDAIVLGDSGTVGPRPAAEELDPLMGSASSLFPLIGRTANLVAKIRQTPHNTPVIIDEARSLQRQIKSWRAPLSSSEPEDPSLDVTHTAHTSEAYRWATLLYLHQAVPELESPSSAILARYVLTHLAQVPLSSRAIIVHIFPLLAAGCESVGLQREWVEGRWTAMVQRMWIGNVDRCLDVVREVWRRRDEAENGQEVDGVVDFAHSVRGDLHWVAVMKGWSWEVGTVHFASSTQELDYNPQPSTSNLNAGECLNHPKLWARYYNIFKYAYQFAGWAQIFLSSESSQDVKTLWRSLIENPTLWLSIIITISIDF
ncbi:MAG: hypothetical protein M1829_003685 [Trizodia sp. TS-e1964]|nr:MAG: hypothetical protein M1829_003685 [Trizodia sp. TS-e1964]